MIFILILLFIILFCSFVPYKESFKTKLSSSSSLTSSKYYNQKYSHNVDLPLTTNYTCNNMCGSQSKCYLTGEQCTSDTDCYGCNIPNFIYDNNEYQNIRGNNNAGKYSYLVPQYSKITTDIGTQAKIYDIKNKNSAPPPVFFGEFLYTDVINLGSKMNKDNSSFIWNPKPSDKKYTIKYPRQTSATGFFLDYGPLASNAYL